MQFMNEHERYLPERNGNGPDYETVQRVNVYDYLLILARHKILFAAIVTLLMGATVLYLLVMPQTYAAGATLLPPDKSEGTNLTALVKGGASLDFSALSENSSSEVIARMLSSRAIADSIIRRFDLLERWGYAPRDRQRAIDDVLGSLGVTSDRQGFIDVSFNVKTGFMPSRGEIDSARFLSAAIVNYAVDALDRLNRQKSVSSARRSREFLERQREQQRLVLDSLQRELQRFQDQNRAFAIDEQSKVSMEGLISLGTEIRKVELQLAEAESEFRSGPVIDLLRRQLASLQARRRELEAQGVGPDGGGFALRRIPELTRRYLALRLDLEIATEVYTYLETQYHHERVQEERDLPTVSVLDAATPPLVRSSPRRTVLALIALALSLVVATLVIFAIEGLGRQWRGLDADRRVRFRRAVALRRRSAIGEGPEA